MTNGALVLSGGGAKMSDGDKGVVDAMKEEYPALYRRFAELIRESRSDVDGTPFRLVMDSFDIARHVEVEPFYP